MDIMNIEGITAGYGHEEIVRDVTFAVPAAGILGIIGPNGAGKTTLFKVMSKLKKPSGGSVRFRGRDVSGISYREFAGKIAVIPQFRSVPPPFTVEEFVSLGRYPHGSRLSRLSSEDRLIVEENMSLLHIDHFRMKRMNELSGGEMQRVFLAQGLIQSPELILMDEPTTHLDITHKIRILDIIGSLTKSKGLAAVIILHDLNLTAMYCERVIMMKEGGIFAQGTPEDVLTERAIHAVYATPVRVDKDPETLKPRISFLPQS